MMAGREIRQHPAMKQSGPTKGKGKAEPMSRTSKAEMMKNAIDKKGGMTKEQPRSDNGQFRGFGRMSG